MTQIASVFGVLGAVLCVCSFPSQCCEAGGWCGAHFIEDETEAVRLQTLSV